MEHPWLRNMLAEEIHPILDPLSHPLNSGAGEIHTIPNFLQDLSPNTQQLLMSDPERFEQSIAQFARNNQNLN